MSYGSYDFSSYVMKKEIGYSLYQLHGWIMLLLGIGSLACWYFFSSKQKESPVIASDLKDNPFEPSEDSDRTTSSSEDTWRPSESHPVFSVDAVTSSTGDKAETYGPSQKDSEVSKPASENASRLITSFSSKKSVRTESDSLTHSEAKNKETQASDDSPFSPPTGF